MSMNWYFHSFSNEKFDAFRANRVHAETQLTKFFETYGDGDDEIPDHAIVRQLVDNGLTYNGLDEEKYGLMALALENYLFSYLDELPDDILNPTEEFEIVPETDVPIRTGFIDWFPELSHPILLAMNGDGPLARQEVFLLSPNEMIQIKEEILPLLRNLENEKNELIQQAQRSEQVPAHPKKSKGFLANIKSFFQKSRKEGISQNELPESPLDIIETKIYCLKGGFLEPIDSMIEKGKYAFLVWA